MNSGELFSAKKLAQMQSKKDIYYGSAFNQNAYSYKLELIKINKPDIVAIGSSRIMQLRKEMFTTSFINAGGAVNDVFEANAFVDHILSIYTPKVVIFSVDDWWFNEKSKSSIANNPKEDESSYITPEKLINPFKMLLEQKISFSDYVKIVTNFNIEYNAKHDDSKLLGLSAIIKGDGFRADGSYFYGHIVNAVNVEDYQFRETKRRISSGMDRFEYGDKISLSYWNRFVLTINKLKSNGVMVFVVMPPYANTIFDILDGNKNYMYMKELGLNIVSMGGYDFRSPKILGLTDCNFIDGFHASEVAYLKMIFSLKDKGLVDFINNDILSKVQLYSNQITIPVGLYKNFRETDFLGVGCKRD